MSGEDFDPEGSGYDYATAKKHGLGPDDTGHWPSRVPQTGQLLKGRNHPTWNKTEEAETDLGHIITKINGAYFSLPADSESRATTEATMLTESKKPVPALAQPAFGGP